MHVQKANPETLEQMLGAAGHVIVMYGMIHEHGTHVGGAMRRAFGRIAGRYQNKAKAVFVDLRNFPRSKIPHPIECIPDFAAFLDGKLSGRFPFDRLPWNAPGVTAWFEELFESANVGR